METLIFIITIVFVIGVTVAEARHDYWVIKIKQEAQDLHLKLYPLDVIFTQEIDNNRWKIWGNLYELVWIVFFGLVAAYLLKSWSVLFWPPVLWLIRTIFHDGFIALFLDEKFTYVSDTGFDGAMKRICLGSGAIYLGVKIFILAILIMSYLSVRFNWDLWQMILNIFR